ncbi:MAG: hypothetical protein GY720_15940 [bacterium]|nr:hypothetical protein [bacterium]
MCGLVVVGFCAMALGGCTMGKIVDADNTGYGDAGISVPIFAPLPGCEKGK